jgi:phosphoenolpyruvate phosphomutase
MARVSDDFLIFARIESLIAGRPLEEALLRARTYLEGGADGVMIHSRMKDPAEVFAFLDAYEALSDTLGRRKLVICVPTSYNRVTAAELFRRGANIVIHANHLLRASYLAMQQACDEILDSDRSLEVDGSCAPVGEIFDAVGFSDVLRRDRGLAEVR